MAARAPRRLYRSRHDRILGGVAAGVAEYFNIDPTIVRLAWLLTVLWGGAGVVLYIIAWIVVPLDPGGNAYSAAASETVDGETDGDIGGPRSSGTTRGGHGGNFGARRSSGPDRDQSAIGWTLVGIGLLVVLFGTNFLVWLFDPVVMLAVVFIIIGLFFLGKQQRPPRVR